MEIIYDEDPASFEVRSGNVIVRRISGEKRVRPLAVFRIETERANAALAAYDAKNAEVIPIGRRTAAAH